MSDRSQSILDKFFTQAVGEHLVTQGREERFKSLLSDLIDAELAARNPISSDSGQPEAPAAPQISDQEPSAEIPTPPNGSPIPGAVDSSASIPTETISDGSSPSSTTEDPTTDSATSSPAESPVSEETHAA